MLENVFISIEPDSDAVFPRRLGHEHFAVCSLCQLACLRKSAVASLLMHELQSGIVIVSATIDVCL